MYAAAGIWGYQVMDDPINTKLPDSIATYVPADIKLMHALGSLFTFLLIIFSVEHIVKSFKHNPSMCI